jgi:hypothetical protein
MSSHDPSSTTSYSPKQRSRTLKRQESLLKPILTSLRTANVGQRKLSQQHLPPTSRTPLEEVPKCDGLWFKDGDVIIWAGGKQGSSLFRVHRRVLKESRAEPFCTVVDCDYPSPETSNETFLDGVWVLKYDEQDPVEVMYVIKWMYERP